MSGRFEVFDRPVGSDDGAFLAGHAPVLLALGTGCMIGCFVGVGSQRLGGEAGGNLHRDGVCGAFDLLEGHGLGSSQRMVVLLAEDGKDFVGDTVEFFRRGFREGHGQLG